MLLSSAVTTKCKDQTEEIPTVSTDWKRVCWVLGRTEPGSAARRQEQEAVVLSLFPLQSTHLQKAPAVSSWVSSIFLPTHPILWSFESSFFFFFQSCTSGSFLEAIVVFFHSEQIFLKLEKINGCVALDYCQKEWHSKVTPARGLSPLNGSKPVALERHITCLSPYLWQSEEEKHICTVRYLFSKKSGAMFWQRWATSLFNSSFHLMLFSSKTLHF